MACAAAIALVVAGAGLCVAARAARADPTGDADEQADPFWPSDAGMPEAGTRHREVLSYPFSCTCRAAASPDRGPGPGGALGAPGALLAVLAAAVRRARSPRTPSAKGNRD